MNRNTKQDQKVRIRNKNKNWEQEVGIRTKKEE